ncbi:MAG: hypothetical protein U9O64_08500 [Campylobacterota bacterium]|nr:hypothetical protein [Campylobacterota bacterium]
MSSEELVSNSEYIVVAQMQNIHDTNKTTQWIDVKVTVVKNELKVIGHL